MCGSGKRCLGEGVFLEPGSFCLILLLSYLVGVTRGVGLGREVDRRLTETGREWTEANRGLTGFGGVGVALRRARSMPKYSTFVRVSEGSMESSGLLHKSGACGDLNALDSSAALRALGMTAGRGAPGMTEGRRKRLVDAVEDGLPPTHTGVTEAVNLGPAGHLQSEGTKNLGWGRPTE